MTHACNNLGSKELLDELVTTSLLDIIRVDKDQWLINEGLITDLNDGKTKLFAIKPTPR